MKQMHFRSGVWLGALTYTFAAALVFTGCNDDPARLQPESLPPVASASIVDTAGSIFRSLTVNLNRPARVEVFYAPVAGGRVFRMHSDTPALVHDLLLPRLRAATSYTFAVRTYDDTGVADSIYRGTFATNALPAELSTFNYTIAGTATFPLVMFPFRSTTTGWAGQVALETDGTIVWYMPSVGGTLVAAPVPGTNDMVFIENGFPNDGGRNGIVRASPDRRVVNLLERGSGAFGQIHHDITAVDDQRVLFLAFETRTIRDTLVTGEAIWEWNTTTNAVVKKWSSFEALNWDTDRLPGTNPGAWLHANSITIGPRGNIVVSFRTQNQVISIAPDFQSLEWRIGGPGATVGLAPQDVFISQHSASEVVNGRLLLFDNRGAGAANDHSRALELRIETDTAFSVWEYDPSPPISALLRGGVYRLSNGNTFTVFTALPFEIHETTPAGERIWSMTGDETFTAVFRAAPWSDIAGEVEVDAMP